MESEETQGFETTNGTVYYYKLTVSTKRIRSQ